MVFFNYATMQMAAKIVYYGPGLCGKTTNLHHIYAKTSPQSRGEMVSLETESDRTLFFDLLPIDVGVIGGFKTRLQLYTIPGQVFYNTTRKLVLKGVDGLVFVADSQLAMLDANVESIHNLRENLAEIGLNLDDIPMVLQINKRDLPNIAAVELILDAIDAERRYDYTEAIASSGVGVFETLKLISKLTLRTLRRRMTGEEPVRPAPRRSLGDVAQFRVKEDVNPRGSSAPASTIGKAAPIGPAFSAPAAIARGAAVPLPKHDPSTQVFEDEPEQAASAAPMSHPEPVLPPFDIPDPIDVQGEMPATPEQPSPPPVPAPAPVPEHAPEPEVDFRRTEKAAKPAVKTVKVRSTIDVMAELEALRKRATAAPSKPARKETRAAAKPGLEIHQAMLINVPVEILARTKSIKVTLSFEDAEQNAIRTEENKLDMDGAETEAVSVNLRIDRT